MQDYQPEVSDDPKPLLAKARNWVQTTAGACGVSELPARCADDARDQHHARLGGFVLVLPALRRPQEQRVR